MSGEDDVALIALIVSLIALLISVGQLLQSIFGTAEGFRRTNEGTMSLFAQSRHRAFHLKELCIETTFSTPHFTFDNPGAEEGSLLSKAEDESNSTKDADNHHEPNSKKGADNYHEPNSKKNTDNLHPRNRPVLAIGNAGDKDKDLNELVKGPSSTSKLRHFLKRLGWSSALPPFQLIPSGSRGYAASWLLLLEQLYEDDKKFAQYDGDARYIYKRQDDKLGPVKQQVRYPAIESHDRSWDLLPPDVVRPPASISLGDLLILCFRLRITVQDYRPGRFNADGFGHSFWSLNIQGLGMVVQYRYDRLSDKSDTKYRANTKFVPTEDTDKLAFGIIPGHSKLGIERDWPLLHGQNNQTIPDAMKAHFEDLGVSEKALHNGISERDRNKNHAWETFGDTVLLLAPFLPIDGLGIVKYQPPIPKYWFGSLLFAREGRIVLWKRLQELLFAQLAEKPVATEIPSHVNRYRPTDMPPRISNYQSTSTKLHWISDVLNFFEERYHREFHSIDGLRDIVGKNALDDRAHKYLKQLRSAYTDADNLLAELFNQEGYVPTYQYMVAAHHEMAISVHTAVKQEIEEIRDNEKRPIWDRVGKNY